MAVWPSGGVKPCGGTGGRRAGRSSKTQGIWCGKQNLQPCRRPTCLVVCTLQIVSSVPGFGRRRPRVESHWPVTKIAAPLPGWPVSPFPVAKYPIPCLLLTFASSWGSSMQRQTKPAAPSSGAAGVTVWLQPWRCLPIVRHRRQWPPYARRLRVACLKLWLKICSCRLLARPKRLARPAMLFNS